MNKIQLDPRWISFIVGILLNAVFLLLIIFGIDIPGFGFTFQYGSQEMIINITVILWVACLYVGIFLMTRVFQTQNSNLSENALSLRDPISLSNHDVKKIKSWSLPWSRIFCVILLVVSIIFQYIMFGPVFLNEEGMGSWLFLGGPTLFYPTSLVSIPTAIGLLIYSILSISRITMVNTGDKMVVLENRFGIKYITEFEKDSITAYQLTNAKAGPTYFWVLLLGLPTYYLFIDAVAYLTNQFTYDQGYVVGFSFLFQVLINIAVLVLLLFFHQTHLELHTKEKRYELEFMPVSRRFKTQCKEFLNDYQSEMVPQPIERINHSLQQYRRLVVSIILVGVAIISRVLHVYSSEPMRLILIFSGIIIFEKSIKHDLKTKRYYDIIKTSNRVTYNSNNNKILFIDDVWDILICLALPIITFIGLIRTFLVLPSSSAVFAEILIVHLIFFLVINTAVCINYVNLTEVKNRLKKKN